MSGVEEDTRSIILRSYTKSRVDWARRALVPASSSSFTRSRYLKRSLSRCRCARGRNHGACGQWLIADRAAPCAQIRGVALVASVAVPKALPQSLRARSWPEPNSRRSHVKFRGASWGSTSFDEHGWTDDAPLTELEVADVFQPAGRPCVRNEQILAHSSSSLYDGFAYSCWVAVAALKGARLASLMLRLLRGLLLAVR